MTCHPCVKKWTRFYQDKGFTEEEAEVLARRLVARVERRQKKELYRNLKNTLFKWTFIVNVRATLLNSVRNRRLVWVGKGFNPDYVLACVGTNGAPHCLTDPDDPCSDPNEGGLCVKSCTGGTCACPAPTDPNSHQVSSGCGQVYNGTCFCRFAGGHFACYGGIGPWCTCGGVCGFDCDTGYVWNGSQCVFAPATHDKNFMNAGVYLVIP